MAVKALMNNNLGAAAGGDRATLRALLEALTAGDTATWKAVVEATDVHLWRGLLRAATPGAPGGVPFIQ